MGGAVLHPTIEALQIAEVASLNNRVFRTLGSSIIVPKKDKIEIVPTWNDRHAISIDNQNFMINNISILWWIAYYTYDERLEDPYYYTKRFLSGSYRGNAVAYFSSNLVSNKEIVLGTLEAIYELIDENKMIENRFSYSNANKILNLGGVVVVLDFLSKDEIKNIVKENLLNTEKIKRIDIV